MLLQASTTLADWRSVISYVVGLRLSVARLPPGSSSYRRKDTALAGTYEHLAAIDTAAG